MQVEECNSTIRCGLLNIRTTNFRIQSVIGGEMDL